MSTFQVIELDGKSIIVEVEPGAPPAGNRASSIPVPEGAEPTGVGESLHNASKLIEDTVTSVVATVKKSLESVAPGELKVELALSFKGENSPVPVLVKIGSEASIKISAKWTAKP